MKHFAKTAGTVFLLVLAAIAVIPLHAGAQDNPIIAIGKVNANGSLASNPNANAVGGTVASIRNGPGDYSVTITAAGAFSGDTVDDFVAEVTCEGGTSNDEVPKIAVTTVTSGVLTLQVHIDDVEDTFTTDVNTARPFDTPFFFSVYRIPARFAKWGPTKYLLATGKVSSGGILQSGALGIDGIEVASPARAGDGSYALTLTKPGSFTGASANDFVILLSLNSSSAHDRAIRGEVQTITDSTLTIHVNIDDIQEPPSDNSPVGATSPYHFTIYRIPPGPGTGIAKSQFLRALGSVNPTGGLVAGGAYGGGALASAHNSAGSYTVTLTSAGAFSGRSEHDFILQVHLGYATSSDVVIDGDLSIVDGDTLRLNVWTRDGEAGGTDAGLPFNSPFYFLIYDARSVFQPDLHIGLRRSLSQQVGGDIYNAGGARQQLNVRLQSVRTGKYWLTLENDGNASDDIFLKAKRPGNKISIKYFRVTGGRRNVTAAMTSGRFVVDNVAPTKAIKYEVQAKYKIPNRRPAKTLRYLARSEFLGSRLDANKAKLVPK